MAKRADTGLHAIHPLARNAIGSAIVKRRNHIALQQIVKRIGFDLVLIIRILVRPRPCRSPSRSCVIRRIVPDFVPPAIERAQVKSPLAAAFMPLVPLASSGRKRRIKPDVQPCTR